jgi:hypothetical protein
MGWSCGWDVCDEEYTEFWLGIPIKNDSLENAEGDGKSHYVCTDGNRF